MNFYSAFALQRALGLFHTEKQLNAVLSKKVRNDILKFKKCDLLEISNKMSISLVYYNCERNSSTIDIIFSECKIGPGIVI